jgi:hypothetical protein
MLSPFFVVAGKAKLETQGDRASSYDAGIWQTL